jgi:hypothetical protein
MEPSRTMTLTRAERASAAMCRVLDIAARVLRGLTILAIASVAAIAIAWSRGWRERRLWGPLFGSRS